MNNQPTIQAIILAAGQGSRFNTGITKLVAPICGQPMVLYPIKVLESCGLLTTVVVGFQKERVQHVIEQAQLPNLTFVEQPAQLGTGHALLCTKTHWHSDNILVMNGDMPLVTAEIIQQLCKEHINTNAAMSFVVAHNTDPQKSYGRIVHNNGIIKIVEKKHFTGDIEQHPLINAGIYLINRAFLETYLEKLEHNAQTRELYITDLVEVASSNTLPVNIVTVPYAVIHGVNTFHELAATESIKQAALVHYWMERGVHFIAPHTNQLHVGVTIGKGTVINPGVQLLGTTTVGAWCTLAPHAVVENSVIEDHVTIGAHSVISGITIVQKTVVPPLQHVRSEKITPKIILRPVCAHTNEA